MRCLPVFLLIILMIPFDTKGQNAYPPDYFRNPLNIPISLSGGFAECRPNHFHTGLDIKTQQRENLPVSAAADGYISRVSISHSGYGNCIYVKHPNGYTTVYAHLNDFYPALQKFVAGEQYRLQKWNVELYLEPGQFPVKKGQMIAYSGNTGGSAGPHLHFEVRDTETGHVLNGFLFGLPVSDSKPPIAKSLAFYDAGKSIYQQDPVIVPTIAKGRDFVIKNDTFTSRSASVLIGIAAQDFTDNSNNWLGIYGMKLFLDGELQLSTQFDKIDFAQNRYVNAYADFKTKEKTGIWYQGLYRLPNNELKAYTFENDGRGALDISDGQAHLVQIQLSDPLGNSSGVRFYIRLNGESQQTGECKGNTLSHATGGELSTRTIRFKAGPKAFYDDICLDYQETPSDYWSNIVQLNTSDIPIHEACTLSLKLNLPVPFDLRSKLVFVHHVKAASLPGNNPQSGMPARYEQSWATAAVRTFGNYYVDIDTIAPVITPLQKGSDFSQAKTISFRVTDDKTSVRHFQGSVNGQWLRFVRRGNIYTYTFDEYWPAGGRQLSLSAEDESGNAKTITLDIKR